MLSCMCVILFPFLFYYVIYYCLLHVFITYFILHIIMGVCFYLFYFYFLLYCMNLKNPNPTHIPGPFAPLASSPPCTHLCPLVSPSPLAHTSLPPNPFLQNLQPLCCKAIPQVACAHAFVTLPTYHYTLIPTWPHAYGEKRWTTCLCR